MERGDAPGGRTSIPPPSIALSSGTSLIVVDSLTSVFVGSCAIVGGRAGVAVTRQQLTQDEDLRQEDRHDTASKTVMPHPIDPFVSNCRRDKM